jgi:malate synthase
VTAYPEVLDAPRMNSAPPGAAQMDLPAGFLAFLEPLHRALTPWQQTLVGARARVLAAAHQGRLPEHRGPSEATTSDWRVELPGWCADQRNQMTGPADDGELVVKMLNSGAPGVMVDVEDSMANTWKNLMRGHRNAVEALHGDLAYQDPKRGREVRIQPSPTVIFTRVRGLHLSQGGVFADGPMSASLFDLALHVFLVDPARLKHPLCIYIPKSESAEEALWWREALRRLARAKGLPDDAIKCMALVESHPLAYQMEEFLFHLRDHILGLNLGRWDYMASLIHFHLPQAGWVLPDRNTIPHDVPFFQRLRERMPEICHRHGVLAIGGMTALYPSRVDAELNARALAVLEKDKRNEAQAGMDGAWTGHPDQNEIAVAQFPHPNQLGFRRQDLEAHPDLRPMPEGVGRRTVSGSRTAARVTTLYRYGVLTGRGASLIEGYMEDLATDRIYRLMLAQRTAHHREAPVLDENGQGGTVAHTPELVTRLYDEELEALRSGLARDADPEVLRRARLQSEQMVVAGWHDPV